MKIIPILTRLKPGRRWIALSLVFLGIGLFFLVASFAAFRSTLRDAERGDVTAQVLVADRYKGRERFEHAALWYGQAAAQGNLAAMYQLANLHRFARIEHADAARAFALMKVAADGHYVEAQLSLSNFYRIGDIIERDYAAAYLWADIARYNQFKPGDRGAHLLSVSIEVNYARRHLTPEQVVAAHRASWEWRQAFPDIYRQDLTEQAPASDQQAGNK